MSEEEIDAELRELSKRVHKRQAFEQEIDAAYQLINTGNHYLLKEKTTYDNLYAPMQCLASGFERVFKCILVFQYLAINAQYPEFERKKTKDFFLDGKNSHDLQRLLNRIKENFYNSHNRVLTEFQKESLDFLWNDEKWLTVLEILSDFNCSGRFENIDKLLTNDDLDRITPFQKFSRWIQLMADNEIEKTMSFYDAEHLRLRLAVIAFERSCRAISIILWHFTGEEGKINTRDWTKHLLRMDGDLGKLRNLILKERPSDLYAPIRKGTLRFFKICWGGGRRMKKITKDQLSEWPFTHRIVVVTIICVSQTELFILIANDLFALNGTTSSRYRIPTLNESMFYRPEVGAYQELREIAVTLCR